MADKMYTCGNGHEVDWDVYIDSLRKAWTVYGHLVGDGRMPAYDFDGSEKQQMTKYQNILLTVGSITDALASFNGDTVSGGGFDAWNKANRPGPDEDFPDEPDANGYYHDMTPETYDEVTPSTLLKWGFKIIPPEKPAPAEKPAKKGKKAKSKKSSKGN